MRAIISESPTKIKHNLKTTSILSTPDWETNFVTQTNQLRQEAFIEAVEELDEEYFNTAERKNKHLSKDKCQKTIVTIFGTITYTRRKYICKTTNTYFYYIDHLLNLIKYQRVTNTAKAHVLEELLTYKLSYEKATRRLGLTKTFAYNLLKNLDTESITLQLPESITCKNLHVIADEDHVAIQDKYRTRTQGSTNRHMLRQVTIYTGIKEVSKGRNELIGRVVFSQHKQESIDEFSDRVHKFICNNYEVEAFSL